MACGKEFLMRHGQAGTPVQLSNKMKGRFLTCPCRQNIETSHSEVKEVKVGAGIYSRFRGR